MDTDMETNMKSWTLLADGFRKQIWKFLALSLTSQFPAVRFLFHVVKAKLGSFSGSKVSYLKQDFPLEYGTVLPRVELR